jgi:hypothetical protein
LSSTDFRANRLVDKLAARHAKPSEQARKGQKLVTEIKTAAKGALATLGRVTWAANNCKVTVLDAEGKQVEKVCRDATGPPKKAKNRNTIVSETRQAAKEKAAKEQASKQEEFTAREADTLLRRHQAKVIEKPKPARNLKRKKAPLTQLPKASNQKQDAAKIAKYTELMTVSAQTQGSDYISFSSFLAIGQSPSSSSNVAPTQGSGGTSQNVMPEIDLAEAESQARRPIEKAPTEVRATRTRPIKDKGAGWGSKKQADEAVKNLLGKPQKAGQSGCKKTAAKTAKVKKSESRTYAP